MKNFAFIVNPVTIKQIKDLWPAIRIVPDFILSSSLKNIPHFKVAHIKRIQSIQGKEIEGYIIVCPLLQRLDKILAAAHFAENLGVKIIGLDGYASMLLDGRYNEFAKNLKIPITTGSALGAWSIFEAIYRAAKIKNVDLKKSNLLVLGATKTIGSLCAKKMSDCVASITIVSDQQDKLLELKEKTQHLNPIEISIESDARKAAKFADIVVNANDSSAMEFGAEDLKANAIVCDISLAANLFKELPLRPDITVIKSGLIKLPYPVKLGINTGLPEGIIWATLAETMLLTFEEKFISYSLGDDTNLDRLEEIADLAAGCGFEVWVPQAPVL